MRTLPQGSLLLLPQLLLSPLLASCGDWSSESSLDKALDECGVPCWKSFLHCVGFTLPPNIDHWTIVAANEKACEAFIEGTSCDAFEDEDEEGKNENDEHEISHLSRRQSSSTIANMAAFHAAGTSGSGRRRRDLTKSGQLDITLQNSAGLGGAPYEVVATTATNGTTAVPYGGGNVVQLSARACPFDQGVVRVADQVVTVAGDSGATLQILVPQFYGLVVKAGLVEMIDQSVSITILAPKDEAIIKCSEYIDKLSEEELKELVEHHVIKGVQYSPELQENSELMPLAGKNVKVTFADGSWHFDGVEAEDGDFLMSNGIIDRLTGVLSKFCPERGGDDDESSEIGAKVNEDCDES